MTKSMVRFYFFLAFLIIFMFYANALSQKKVKKNQTNYSIIIN